MGFARASLELQARLLPVTMLRRFACDAIAEGQDGPVIRQLASQVGQPRRELDELIASMPDIEQRLIVEAGLPTRTPEQARWEIFREIVRSVTEGDVRPRDGAFALARLAQDVDDARLGEETRKHLAIVDQWEWDQPELQDRMEAAMLAEISRLALLT